MTTPWVVCQLGAREHYAIPRALKRKQVPFTLITDYWSRSSVLPLIDKRLSQRKHQDIDHGEVVSFNREYLLSEAFLKMKGLASWQLFSHRNQWFGKKVEQRLPAIVSSFSSKPVIFSYSYASLAVFRKAKELGCKTILGQIDVGIEDERIMVNLYNQHGLGTYPVAPKEYWRDWQLECDLADSIVVNSQWSRDCLVRAGICQSKIQIVGLAYESSFPKQLTIRDYPRSFTKERPLRVLFLGRLSPRKGAIELAQAIKALQSEPIEWTMVGKADPGVEALFLDALNVKRVDHVSRDEVVRYYQTADVFILPTHCDGFAITQLEAASMGLPIIASRYCGQVVQHGKNGLLLTEVTSEAIVDAITFSMCNPSSLAAMSQCQTNSPQKSLDCLGCDLLVVQESLS